jgi:hypothetical protein
MTSMTILAVRAGFLLGLATIFSISLRAQIGTGWTEYSPALTYDTPPNREMRHTFADGVHHFWVLKSDPSTFPGRDSGPRSEARVQNEYSSGDRQLQADIKVETGSTYVSLVQIFGSGEPHRATAFMLWALGDGFSFYNGPTFFHGIYDVYHRVNIIHTSATGKIDVYVDGAKLGSFVDRGPAAHYNKFGVYGRPQMGVYNGVFFKDVRFFKK